MRVLVLVDHFQSVVGIRVPFCRSKELLDRGRLLAEQLISESIMIQKPMNKGVDCLIVSYPADRAKRIREMSDVLA